MSYFGTDGIRGAFGQTPITPEFALQLGFAAGKVLKRKENKPIVVLGKDTRISGYILESALQAGLNSAGVYVHLLGPLPTPGIAHLTRALHADAGIVISASHNPYSDNGIKFFSGVGQKLDEQTQEAINQQLDQSQSIDNPNELGKTYRVKDAGGRYIEFCKSSFPYQLSLRGITIVLDTANGAAYNVGPAVFRELGARVISIYDQPNGVNINHQCGSTYPQKLQSAVLEYQADVGIAFDGDADRVVMVDAKGRLIDGDYILYILALHCQQKPQGVVGTVMSNMALEVALKQQNVGFIRANVGDRYVMSELLQRNWLIGGEPSGHILCLDKSTTGDAIISALQILTIMVQKQATLADLCEGFSLFPQQLINVRIAQRIEISQSTEIQNAIKTAELALGDRGRVLIRASGTEPLIRVMVEGQDVAQTEQLAKQLAEVVTKAAQV